MRRLFALALPALLGLAGLTRAGECLGCKTRCLEPGPTECRERGCPCDKRLNLTICDKSDKYAAILASCDNSCCARIKAARKLGCRLCADVCANKCVLEALLDALFFDPCWKVRRTAAWSLFGQRAYQDEVILALYVSSKIDPHYMVRSRAAEALDLLTLCHRCCYKELYAQGDVLIKDMRAAKFVPGAKDAREKHTLATVGMAPATLASPEVILAPVAPGARPMPKVQ
jgi:hypothetical protein